MSETKNINTIIMVIYGILALVLAGIMVSSNHGAGFLSFILSFIFGFGGAMIGDFLRKLLMPDMVFTREGFIGLLKAKLFWFTGPQLIGLVIGSAFGAALGA